jgi:hypothetical protein
MLGLLVRRPVCVHRVRGASGTAELGAEVEDGT